jgi:phosphoserine phosphatase RsbU/P
MKKRSYVGCETFMTQVPYPIKVLCIDDQELVFRAIEEATSGQSDIFLKYVSNPTQSLAIAEEYGPSVILLDLVMPEIDGLLLLRYLRANPKIKNVPIIVLSVKEDPQVKKEAFGLGASDYLVKFPAKEELLARLRHHAESYIRLLQRNDAYLKLQENEKRLRKELAAAAGYIKSQLPLPITGTLSCDALYLPSIQVGGDSYGFGWYDRDHFICYLIDVSGQGVKAALHSCAILHVIHNLIEKKDKIILKPQALLKALNDQFPMEKCDMSFFTMWYGIYSKKKNTLTYASAGHPPPLLLPKGKRLESKGVPIGIDAKFSCEVMEEKIGTNDSLFLFSDGCFELEHEGKIGTYDDLAHEVVKPSIPGVSELERLHTWAKHIQSDKPFADDFCLIHLKF